MENQDKGILVLNDLMYWIKDQMEILDVSSLFSKDLSEMQKNQLKEVLKKIAELAIKHKIPGYEEIKIK